MSVELDPYHLQVDPYEPGTSFTDVIRAERNERLVAEENINRRLLEIEDRLMIIDQIYYDEKYPDVLSAYKKFKYEEAKMKTMEALRKQI